MSEKILLVDDEPKVLSALRRSLGQRFTLSCANDGVEALQLLESEGPFAAVVSDMRMPGMNGVELLCEIKRRAPETVRLILSGQSDFSDAVKAINEGAIFRFHTKPVSTEALVESLEIALLQHRHQNRHGGTPGLDLARETIGLRKALRENQLRIFVQPQASLLDGHIHGGEALVRWQHPEKGLLLPGHFLPLVDAAGMNEDITRWMLEAACRELHRWDELGLSSMRLAVNMTVSDIADSGFVQRVADVMARHRVKPQNLELELTEGAAVEDINRARLMLQGLSDLGVHLSIDDFGTGYSSLGWLRRLPIDKLKIDRMFIDDIADDPESYRFLASVMTLARDLNLTTLAEGIETLEQMKQVSRTGCDLVQGFFLAPPMPAEDFPAWAMARSGAPGR